MIKIIFFIYYRDNSKFPNTTQYVSQYAEKFWNYKNPNYMRNTLSYFYRNNYRYHCSVLSALSRYRLFCYRTALIHRVNYKVCMYNELESLIGLLYIAIKRLIIKLH